MDPRLSRRVLTGDDGAPLDSDCVLAVATRWGAVALSLTHLKPGVALSPTDGVGVRWEHGLPVISVSGPVHAFLERGGAAPVASGRLTALELGDVFLATSGPITIEARLQRKSELATRAPKRDTWRLALVMTHSMLFAAAVLAVLVLTPFVPDESAFGPPLRFKIPVTPAVELPKVAAAPQLQERLQKVMQSSALPVLKSVARNSAQSVLKSIFGGAGSSGLLGGGLNRDIDSALNNLRPGGSMTSADTNGLGGPRGTGGGGPPGGMGIGTIGGGLPGGGQGPGPGFGLGAKKIEDIVCRNCTPKLAPGYDRDLVLKVVRKHQNEIRYCYESELQKHPELGGKITVEWTIGSSGAVESAAVAESGLANANVEACIVQRIRRWNFPEPPGGQEVAITFPWVFQVAGFE